MISSDGSQIFTLGDATGPPVSKTLSVSGTTMPTWEKTQKYYIKVNNNGFGTATSELFTINFVDPCDLTTFIDAALSSMATTPFGADDT